MKLHYYIWKKETIAAPRVGRGIFGVFPSFPDRCQSFLLRSGWVWAKPFHPHADLWHRLPSGRPFRAMKHFPCGIWLRSFQATKNSPCGIWLRCVVVVMRAIGMHGYLMVSSA